MRQMDVVVMLHSHLPYVLNHGRWPHGSDWLCEAAIDTYLPLVETLRRLERENVAAPVTVGFTPILVNQLEHESFRRELSAYFVQRLGFCDDAPASLRSTGDEHLIPLVGFWRSRLERLIDLADDIGWNIPAEFRRLQDAERVEVTGSAATHGFLPLLGRDESIRLQLSLGMREHERVFGRPAAGCWLPECAYRGSGWWAPATAPHPRYRRGTEHFVSEAGFGYFFVDAHMARAGEPLGVYGERQRGEAASPERRPTGADRPADGRAGAGTERHSAYETYRVTTANDPSPVAVFVRDPRSSMQVWSRDGGYPGAAAYLEFHKIRWPGGLKLWRVSDPGTDLGGKLPYVPEWARMQAASHAHHFAELLDRIARDETADDRSVIVAPFDTELFGHWWFEGPEFLGDMYAAVPAFPSLRAVTAGRHLAATSPRSGLRLADGSWGRNGDYSMWNNDQVGWTWPVIWELEDDFWNTAPAALARSDLHEILAQAARELLLLQSSDWQFIISTGEVEDYAVRRFNGHAADTRELIDALRDGLEGRNIDAGVARARALGERDDVFREIIPSIDEAIRLSAGVSAAVERFEAPGTAPIGA